MCFGIVKQLFTTKIQLQLFHAAETRDKCPSQKPFGSYGVFTFFSNDTSFQQLFSFFSDDTGCPGGWVRHTTLCFHVIDSPTLKWDVARTTCQNLAADLAIITSAAENNFIVDLIKKQQTVTNGGAWLGLYRKADNNFYWVDDTPLGGQYSAWASGEPNSHDEKCVHVYGKGPKEGKWNDDSCSLAAEDANFNSAPVVLCQKAVS